MAEGQAAGASLSVDLFWEESLLVLLELYMHLRCLISTIFTFSCNIHSIRVLFFVLVDTVCLVPRNHGSGVRAEFG